MSRQSTETQKVLGQGGSLELGERVGQLHLEDLVSGRLGQPKRWSGSPRGGLRLSILELEVKEDGSAAAVEQVIAEAGRLDA